MCPETNRDQLENHYIPIISFITQDRGATFSAEKYPRTSPQLEQSLSTLRRVWGLVPSELFFSLQSSIHYHCHPHCAMSSDRVDCYCRKCNLFICSYQNAWLQISNTHSTYEVSSLYSQNGLKAIGEVRHGAMDSGLEGCSLQSLRCDVCNTVLGLKCIRAPEGKEFYKYV